MCSILSLSFRNPVVVNSTFTFSRMSQLWSGRVIQKLYPPIHKLPLNQSVKASEKKNWIVSLAQMRPEKNHKLQIEAIAHWVDNYSIPQDDTRVLICGSLPPHSSQTYFTYVMKLAEESFKNKAISLSAIDHSQRLSSPNRQQILISCPKETKRILSVEFHLNLPMSELHSLLRHAKVRSP